MLGTHDQGTVQQKVRGNRVSEMNAEGGTRMEKQARKRSHNWVIAVERQTRPNTRKLFWQQSPGVPTSFSNGVGTRMALIG